MGDIATILPAVFGIMDTRAVKERGYFLCKTETGPAKIHKTHEHHQSIRLRHALLEKLDAAGFPWTDKISLSTYGIPYVQLGRDTYVMSRHIRGHDLNLDCPKDVIPAVESIAHFHAAATGMTFCDSVSPDVSPSVEEVFAKNAAFLVKTVRQVNKHSRLSDFDVMFIKNIPRYESYVSQSTQILAQTDYAALYATATAEKHICHNALKEENLPILEGRCYITNFTETSVDAQITDLASFLHRYARRSQRAIPLNTLIEAYDRILPLPQSAAAIIYAQLIHPWQFIKIAQQYYSKKRGWTPAAIMSRMSNLLHEQEGYDTYINSFRLLTQKSFI